MKPLKDWEKATQNLAEYFIARYFRVDDVEYHWKSDCFWVSDQIGDVLSVGDYFFSVEDMLDFIRYKYSEKEVFDYYDYRLKAYNKKETVINIKNWKNAKSIRV